MTPGPSLIAGCVVKLRRRRWWGKRERPSGLECFLKIVCRRIWIDEFQLMGRVCHRSGYVHWYIAWVHNFSDFCVEGWRVKRGRGYGWPGWQQACAGTHPLSRRRGKETLALGLPWSSWMPSNVCSMFAFKSCHYCFSYFDNSLVKDVFHFHLCYLPLLRWCMAVWSQNRSMLWRAGVVWDTIILYPVMLVQEAIMKKKYGGLMPKKPPLISKVFVRASDQRDYWFAVVEQHEFVAYGMQVFWSCDVFFVLC